MRLARSHIHRSEGKSLAPSPQKTALHTLIHIVILELFYYLICDLNNREHTSFNFISIYKCFTFQSLHLVISHNTERKVILTGNSHIDERVGEEAMHKPLLLIT